MFSDQSLEYDQILAYTPTWCILLISKFIQRLLEEIPVKDMILHLHNLYAIQQHPNTFLA